MGASRELSEGMSLQEAHLHGRSEGVLMKEDYHSHTVRSPSSDVDSAIVAKEAACCPATTRETAQNATHSGEPYRSGCMVCGAELVYSGADRDSLCHYCGKTYLASALCANGHYVCDHCHSADPVEIIRNVCVHSLETDMVAIMQTIRAHPGFRMHGPEHHPMVPAVILTALRNSGCSISYQEFDSAIQRGRTIVGGSCAFLGACGAAIGVGTALSLLLEATPYDGEKRQAVQQATHKALGTIASFNAPRCCQRDCWLALKEASTLIQEYAGISLAASPFACEQYSENKECIHERCPLWPSNP